MNRVVFSSASDHWETPVDVRVELDKEFSLDFDPCPLNSSDDGLLLKWNGRVFCNPPYSAIPDFIRKGIWHLSEGDVQLLVFLLPARTDTRWFHDYCMKAREIRFLRGRLKFGNAEFNAPFPSMVVIFDQWKIACERIENAQRQERLFA